MARLLSSVILLAAVSCTGSPVQPDSNGIETAGHVTITGESGTSAVSLQVTLRNDSGERIVMQMLAHCPVLLVLLEPDADGGATVFDEGSRPCTRAAQIVDLAPGEERTWHYHVEVETVRAAGVDAGVYQAKALITTSPEPLAVPLGEIRLP